MCWGLIPSWWKKTAKEVPLDVQRACGDGGDQADVSLRIQVGAIYSRLTEGFATADLVAAKSLLNELDCVSGKIVQKIYG